MFVKFLLVVGVFIYHTFHSLKVPSDSFFSFKKTLQAFFISPSVLNVRIKHFSTIKVLTVESVNIHSWNYKKSITFPTM